MMSRSERHWQILVSEYKACRQKLQSKKDGHKILMDMVSERDAQRDALQSKLDSLWQAGEEVISKSNSNQVKGVKDSRSAVQGLVLLVNKQRGEILHKSELIETLQQETSDLKKDIKALRSDMVGFNRVTSPTLDATDQSREYFLATIQALKQEVDLCNAKITTLNDEATDFRIEREFYKQKLKSVTEQLLEKNQCQPIADIEKLLEDNRLLREKIDKLQHINAALVAHNTALPSAPRVDRVSVHTSRSNYPTSAIKKRKSKQRAKHVTFGADTSAEYDLTANERYESTRSSIVRGIREKVQIESELQHLQRLVIDMQKVSNGLAETVLDKNTALKHQRASNRLLGERVYELEAKLRALEMSGFWNVPDSFAEQPEEGMKRDALRRLTLIGGQGAADEEGAGESDSGLLLDNLSQASGASTRSSPEVDLLSLDPTVEEEDEYTSLLQTQDSSSSDQQDVLSRDQQDVSSRDEKDVLSRDQQDDDYLVDLLPVKEH